MAEWIIAISLLPLGLLGFCFIGAMGYCFYKDYIKKDTEHEDELYDHV